MAAGQSDLHGTPQLKSPFGGLSFSGSMFIEKALRYLGLSFELVIFLGEVEMEDTRYNREPAVCWVLSFEDTAWPCVNSLWDGNQSRQKLATAWFSNASESCGWAKSCTRLKPREPLDLTRGIKNDTRAGAKWILALSFGSPSPGPPQLGPLTWCHFISRTGSLDPNGAFLRPIQADMLGICVFFFFFFFTNGAHVAGYRASPLLDEA